MCNDIDVFEKKSGHYRLNKAAICKKEFWLLFFKNF